MSLYGNKKGGRTKVKKTMVILSLVLLICILTFSGCTTTTEPTTSEPVSAAEFYKGKNITMLLGIGAGGGSDLQARIISSYLGPAMGSNVGVVNESAASGLVARNNFHNNDIIKPDGLTIMSDPAGHVTSWLLNAEGVTYDIRDFSYLGAINCAVSGIVVKADGPYQTVEELKAAKGLKFGASTPGTLPTMAMLAAIEILDLDAEVIIGYQSAGDRRLALDQGEIHAMSNTIDTASAEIESGGNQKILFTVSLERDPNFPDVPSIAEFVDLTDYHKSLIAGVPNDYKMVFAAPNTPEDRVDYLRESLWSVYEDAGFQKSIKNISMYWQGALHGKDVQQYIDELTNNKENYLELFSELMQKYIP